MKNNEAGFDIINDVVFNQVLVQCETDELTKKPLKTFKNSASADAVVPNGMAGVLFD